MRSFWALFALVALSSAQYAWKEDQSYTYDVVSVSTASLTIGDRQHTGIALQAQLKIQAKSHDELFAGLHKVQYRPIHGQDRKEAGFKALEMTQENFIIQLKNGVVKGLKVSKTLPAWEVTIIKSIVSQLQVDAQKENLIPATINSLPSEENSFGVYRTLEDTVDGYCEVLYEVAPIPKFVAQGRVPNYSSEKKYLEIVKTKNFDKCKQLPIFHQGLSQSPAASQIDNFMTRSSISNIILSGSIQRHNIEFSSTVNIITLSPEIYNEQKAEVFTQVNLTLTHVERNQENVRPPQNPRSLKSLVADYDTPITVEQWEQKHQQLSAESSSSSSSSSSESLEEWHEEISPIHEAQFFPFNPYATVLRQSKNTNPNQIMRKLIDQIAQQLRKPSDLPKENTLDRFTLLTELVRAMSEKQLQQATAEIYSKEHHKQPESPNYIAWMTLRDTVAQAGTGAALKTIRSWIERGIIMGEEAAQIVSTLPNSVILPSPTYVESFFTLVKSPEVTKDQILRPAALFAFSKLVRRAQTDRKGSIARYPVHVFGPTYPEKGDEVIQKYIFYIDQQLQQAVASQDSHQIQVAIVSLGHIAHPKILRVFEPYLEGKQQISTYQRTLMVVALKKLSILYPRVARSVMFKIYSNKNEAYQVRVAAVYNLMKSDPPASILQRMAEEARYELDINVKSAVKSSIESAARQAEGDLQRNAQAAVNLLPNDIFSVQNSRDILKSYILKGLNLGYKQQLQYIGSQDSDIPQGIFHELTTNINGLRKTGYRFESLFSSVSDLFDAIEKNFQDEPSEDFKDESPIDKIEKELLPKRRWKKPVEGNVQMDLGSMTRLFTFNNKTILPSIRDIQQVLMVLRDGQHFNYQKLYQEEEVVLSFPTALGFPSIFSIKKPTLVTVFGQVKLQSPSLEDVMNQAEAIFSLSGEGQAVYSTRTQSRIGLFIPFEQKQYVAGHDRNIQVILPLRAKINIQSQGKVHLEIMPSPQEKKPVHRLIHYSTWPFISKQEILDFKPLAEEPTTRYISVRQPMKSNVIVGEKYGIPVKVILESEERSMDFKTLYDHMEDHDWISAFVFPWAESSLEKTQFDVFLDTSKTKPVSITATYEFNSWDNQNSNSNKEEQSNEAESGQRQRNILKRLQKSFENPSVFALDLGMEFKTAKPIKLFSTIGVATSGNKDSYQVLGDWSRQGESSMKASLNVYLKSKNVPVIGKYHPTDFHPKMDISIQLDVGESEISAQGSFERTLERLRYLMHQPLSDNTTFQSGLMDKYSVSLKYNKVSNKVKDLTYQAYNALRYLGYFNLHEQPAYSAEDSAELQWQFTPDLQSVDVSVSSPMGKSSFQGLNVDKYWRTISVLHPTLNVWDRINWHALRQFPSCTVDPTSVSTLENVTVPVHFGNTWHVLMISSPQLIHDASYDSTKRFVVIAKEADSESLFVDAIFEDYNNALVEFRPESADITKSVYINRKLIKLTRGDVFNYFNEKGRKCFSLVADDQKVTFDSLEYGVTIFYYFNKVILLPGSQYKDRLNGICGTFDGEKYLTSPQSYILEDPKEFVKTWTVTPGPKKISTKVQKDLVYTNVVSDQDAGRADMMGRPVDKDYYDSSSSSSSSESNESKISSKATLHKKLMVIEREGKHCFSIWPQPSCKTPSRVQKTQTKQTEFVCVEKNETSRSWAKLVARGARPDFSKKGNAQTIEVQVPIACSYI